MHSHAPYTQHTHACVFDRAVDRSVDAAVVAIRSTEMFARTGHVAVGSSDADEFFIDTLRTFTTLAAVYVTTEDGKSSGARLTTVRGTSGVGEVWQRSDTHVLRVVCVCVCAGGQHTSVFCGDQERLPQHLRHYLHWSSCHACCRFQLHLRPSTPTMVRGCCYWCVVCVGVCTNSTLPNLCGTGTRWEWRHRRLG